MTANCVPITYTLTTTNSSGGTVTTPAGIGDFPEACGDSVNIVASNYSCYTFLNWSGSGVTAGKVTTPTAANTYITMDDNYTVKANFQLDQYDLTVNSSGCCPIDVSGGVISETVPAGTSKTYTNIDCGTVITVTANEPPSCYFHKWEGDVANPSLNSTTVTVDGDKTVTGISGATPTYSLTVTSNGCCPIDVSGNASGTVPAGESIAFPGIDAGEIVYLTANNSSCCSFTDWTDNVYNDDSASTYIVVNSNEEVTANCAIKKFALTVTANNSGGMPTFEGDSPFDCNTPVTIHANTSSCYNFSGWTPLDGVASPSSENTTVNMSQARTLNASYTIKTYTLTTSATNGSVTTPSVSPSTFNCSENVSIVATPANASCSFVNWTGNTETILNVSAASTYIIMNSSKTIVANFNVSSASPPEDIDDLSVISVECNWIRLSWSAPEPGSGVHVDSYTVKRSASSIDDDTDWNAATLCSDVDFANLGTPRNPGVTETCTVNNLSDLTKYYFAIKSTKGALTSAVSNSPNGSTMQRQHKPGDWWLWHIRYDQATTIDCFTGLIQNNAYHITNVFEVNASKKVYVNNAALSAGNGVTVTGLARINWNCDETANRTRMVDTNVAGFAVNIMHDTELWVDSRDLTMQVEMDALTEATAKIRIFVCITAAGNGPAENYFTYQQGTVAPGSPPTPGAPDDGYPYAPSQAWDAHQFIKPWAAGAPAEFINDYNWSVNASPSTFNAAANTDPKGAAHAGVGNYTAWTTYNYKEGAAASNVSIRYAPEAHAYVKMAERNAYIGWEDWIIMDYEVGNYSASSLSAGFQRSSPTISVNISNNTDKARSFKLLTLITNMDATLSVSGGSGNYKNGQTVFPTMSNYSSIQSAIHTTQVINPGATVTETWSFYWANLSANCDLWCAGLYSWK